MQLLPTQEAMRCRMGETDATTSDASSDAGQPEDRGEREGRQAPTGSPDRTAVLMSTATCVRSFSHAVTETSITLVIRPQRAAVHAAIG